MNTRRIFASALNAVLVASLVVSGFVATAVSAVAQTTDYPLNFSDDLLVSNSEGRQLNSFTLTGATSGATSTITLDNSGQNLVYRKMLTSEAAVLLGESVSVSIDYTGSYMHAYLYVDLNGDGQFDTTLNADGTPATGSEVVSYTYYNGKNSLGQTTSENVGANGVTFTNAFTIPTTQSTGRFRARLKIDWDNIDPAGQYSEGGTNNLNDNGGYIVDFILKVYSKSCHLDLVTPNGSLVGAGNSGLPATATYKTALTMLPLAAADRYTLESITVRHGYNLDGDAVDAHGNPQWSEYSIAPTTSAFTIAKDSVDGDLRVTANFTQDADARYYLMFSDDFSGEDGTQPDGSKWVRHGIANSVWNRFNATTSAGQKETGYIQDGKFVALCKPNTYSNEYMADGTTVKDMISGAINSSSSFNFKYGRVEARVKTNTLKGNFPAFWLMPNNGSPGWPWCGEIDIWEAVNSSDYAWQTIHSGWANTDNGGYGNSNNPRKSNGVAVSQNEYHVYGLEWTENMLKWYVDGKQVFSYAKSSSQEALDMGQWPFDKEYYIILNQAVGNGTWASSPNTTWTYETDFDWVRVYQIPDVTVTYNYVLADGTPVFTVTDKQPVEAAPEAPTSNLVTIDSWSSNTATVQYDGSTVVTVVCTVNLPFKVSTDTEEYWYAIDMYSSDENTAGMGTSSTTVSAGTKTWLWRYTSKPIVKACDLAQNAQLTDDYLWKIKGDLLNGFTLYNKKAGDELPLNKATTGNVSVRMKAATDAKLITFNLVDNKSIDGAVTLIREGDTHYVHKDASSTDLKGTTTLDASCAIIFRPASEFVLNYYEKNYEGIENAPEGALGTVTSDGKQYVANANAAAATLRANAFDDAATASLVEANSSIANYLISVPNNLTGYYRFVNVAYGTTMSVKTVKDKYSNTFPLSCTLSSDDARSDASTVMHLVRYGTGAVKQYTLSTDGNYIGATTQSTATALSTTDAGATYVFTNSGKGKFSIFNYGGDDYAYLHCSVNQADGVVGWETDADATFWYLVPAQELDVALTSMTDGKSYGTAYLPFPIIGATGGEIFSTALNESGDALTATEINGAPANTGLLLISADNNATLRLAIGESTDEVTTLLTGSLTKTTLSSTTRPKYLLLGETDGVAGFYTATASSIPAHSAYILAADVTATALPLGDITSGIGTLIVSPDAAIDVNAPIYDLSGRRVNAVVKGGVYLQAGKKFIAR